MLFKVDMTTGVANSVGLSHTSDPLALVTVRSTLYGVDTFVTGDPSLYTIDTTTGAATPIGTVTGLPAGYTIDTLAYVNLVPELSSVALHIAGAPGAARLARRRRTS